MSLPVDYVSLSVINHHRLDSYQRQSILNIMETESSSWEHPFLYPSARLPADYFIFQFALSLGKALPYIFSQFNLLCNTDTSLTGTLSMPPSVNVLTGFDCTWIYKYLTVIS